MGVSIVLFCLLFLFELKAQDYIARDIVEKSISFHDPGSVWKNFQDTLFLTQINPENIRSSRIVFLDRKNDVFAYQFEKEDGQVSLYYENGQADYRWNDAVEIPPEVFIKHRLTLDRAILYKNYYLYLYGMPMKILDTGAKIDSNVERVFFHEMDLLKIKVSYSPEVGKDLWYFYFDPKTFELKAYQFFQDESKNDGEYILFSGLSDVGGIKMPKSRSWFTNAEDKLLGVDVLEKGLTNYEKRISN